MFVKKKKKQFKKVIRTTTFLKTSYGLFTFNKTLLNTDVHKYPYLTLFLQISIMY